MPRDYDALAWFYDRFWAGRYDGAAHPVLERLLFSQLTTGARVLELCCGTGHVTQVLAARGYDVIAIDNSIEMLRHARRRVPSARFLCADVERFPLRVTDCAAAVATFDSINHLLTPERVAAAFRSVAGALRCGGVFVFDVNTEEAYRSEWEKSSAVAEPDAALFVRGGYDPAMRLGRTSLTMFRLEGTWQRTDVELAQRCYAPEELVPLLRDAGFAEVVVERAADVGMTGDIAVGRVFVSARKL